MTMYLDDVDEHTRYLCVYLDDEHYLITATHSEATGLAMLDVLEGEYHFTVFDLLSDRPKSRLDEYDYDMFLEYRHLLVRPTRSATPNQTIKPQLTVINGGLSQ